MHKISVGAWRDDSSGPMQVVSGPDRQGARPYEAPRRPAARRGDARVPRLVQRGDRRSIRCSRPRLAHLWFVTIHPFDDGNGRIARAIADMALARSEQSPQRFYSMSAQIRRRAERLLRHPGADAEGDARHHRVDGVVPRLPRTAPSTAPRPRSPACSARRGSGRRMPGSRFNERQRDRSSTDCWTASRASSPRRSGRRLAKCSQDTASATSTTWSNAGILAKDAAGGRSTSYSLAAP